MTPRGQYLLRRHLDGQTSPTEDQELGDLAEGAPAIGEEIARWERFESTLRRSLDSGPNLHLDRWTSALLRASPKGERRRPRARTVRRAVPILTAAVLLVVAALVRRPPAPHPRAPAALGSPRVQIDLREREEPGDPIEIRW